MLKLKKGKKEKKVKQVIRKAWVEIRPIEALRVKWKDQNGNIKTIIDVRSDCDGWNYIKQYCKAGGFKIVKKIRKKPSSQ